MKQKRIHSTPLITLFLVFAATLTLWGGSTMPVQAEPTGDAADAADAPDATEIMRQAHLNYYYAADDGRAEVQMTLTDKRGKERSRRFTMLRLDLEDGGEQRYYTYFHRPNDVARTTFMVWKRIGKDDDRWIYVPAVDLVKRISARDKASSFVGSDFSYEDVSGRHWTDDTHILSGEETLGDEEVWVIESRPVGAGEKDLSFKKTWVTQSGMLPLQEEQYDRKGKLEKVLTTDRVDTVDGVVTVIERTMRNVKKNHSTRIVFESIEYNVGLEEKLFSERYLKAPPRQFIGS